MGPSARKLFSWTWLPWPVPRYSGQILHAKVLEHLVWWNTSGLHFALWGASCSNKLFVGTLRAAAFPECVAVEWKGSLFGPLGSPSPSCLSSASRTSQCLARIASTLSLRCRLNSRKHPSRNLFGEAFLRSLLMVRVFLLAVVRTHRIAANPKKIRFSKFLGPHWRKFGELCVLLFYLGNIDRMHPKSQFNKLIFGQSAGSTKLDRPPLQTVLMLSFLLKTASNWQL